MTKNCFALIIINLFRFSSVLGQADLLIIGGGTGGTAAGIQASRMGVKVTILEETPWLGGMLTSAGVSAIDGNHELPSGIWGEFREALYDYYGGPSKVSTGWVSHTLFEPSVGNEILQKIAKNENLTIICNAQFIEVTKSGDKWVVGYRKDGKIERLDSKILIDATETGEILPLVGADYRVGMDSKTETGEDTAPEKPNSIVQDITYAAILTDLGNSKTNDGLLKKPKEYNKEVFECACKREGTQMFGAVLDCEQMLNYAKLPNGKYLINWPNCGNDYYLNWPELSKKELQIKINEAKNHTKGFIYYIQNDLGLKNLRIADEFPTKDGFPYIPYHRESRRIKGKVYLTTNHLKDRYEFSLYRTGIAVGDYPIDHHHDENPGAPKIEFINIKIPSYNIPLGALIPARVTNFLVAEKNISVSNIVNGTSRLQPVVLGIGQAAGALAAISIKDSICPDSVSVRDVQEELLNYGVYIMPFIDTKPNDKAFKAMQKIGATGILKGHGVPYQWANQTWYYPDRFVSEFEWIQGLLPYYPDLIKTPASGKYLTVEFFEKILDAIAPEKRQDVSLTNWELWDIKQTYDAETPLNRRTVSILTDQLISPFQVPIDHHGHIISAK